MQRKRISHASQSLLHQIFFQKMAYDAIYVGAKFREDRMSGCGRSDRKTVEKWPFRD